MTLPASTTIVGAEKGQWDPAGLLAPLAACVASVLLGLGMLWLLGYAPGDVARVVWEKVLFPADPDIRMTRWAEVLQRATPILLTGLSVAVAFRASVLNIGAEGQYLAGALAGAALGVHWHGSGLVGIPSLLALSALAGALVGAIASALELWRRVPVVLGTLMLNFVMMELLRYLVQGPLREPGLQPQTPLIVPATWLPMIGSTPLHIGFAVAIVLALGLSLLLRFTTVGFRLRIVGENATAARFAGIRVGAVALGTMALSGALAGIAGGIELAGVKHQLVLGDAVSGFGFTGIAVALLGRLRPSGVVAAALFLGLLTAACRVLQAELSLPFVTAQALQGLVILLMLGMTHVRLWRRSR